jgi:hypothetical protein
LDVIDIRIAHRQDVDRLSAVVRLAEPATVVARARVRVRGRVARAIVARNRLETEPRRTYRVRLRIPPAGLHRIKRALRRGARVRAKVTLRVSDAAGNVLTRRGRVRLRP